MKRAYWFAWALGCTSLTVQAFPCSAQERSILLKPARPEAVAPSTVTPSTVTPEAAAPEISIAPDESPQAGSPEAPGTLDAPTPSTPITEPIDSSTATDPPLLPPAISQESDVAATEQTEIVTISIDDLDAPIPPNRITDPSPIGTGVRRSANDPGRRIRVADTPNRRPTGPSTARPLPTNETPAATSSRPSTPSRSELPESSAPAAPAAPELESPSASVHADPIISEEESFAAAFPVVSLEARGPAALSIGQVGRFVLKVSNLGDEEVSSAAIEVALPSHLQWVRSSTAGTPVADAYRFEIGSLHAQEEREILLDAKAVSVGEIRLAARVITVATASINVAVREAKLAIQSTGPDQTASGEVFGFQVTVTNQGQSPIDGVKVVPNVPGGVRVQADFETAGEVGWLEPGESRVVELQFIADRSGRVPLRFVASGAGVSQAADVAIDVVGPSLNVELIGPETGALRGEGEYELTVTNPAESACSAVNVQIDIPVGLRVTTLSRAAEYDARTGRLRFQVPSIEGNGSTTLRFKAVSMKAGDFRIVASASSGSGAAQSGELSVIVR